MLPKRHKAPGHKRAEPVLLLPPNLRTLGPLPFTPSDRDALDIWLSEGGWPRDKMDIATLEGYLVALLVWPVGVSPGAWFPPIWGERGWKIATKIDSADAYLKFTGLVVGFLQELDRGFSAHPPHFRPTPPRTKSPMPGRSPPGSLWAQGFLRALQHDLQGLGLRTPTARSALERIARHASRTVSPAASDNAAAEDLTSAVLLLAAERSTRGPLGALESASPESNHRE